MQIMRDVVVTIVRSGGTIRRVIQIPDCEFDAQPVEPVTTMMLDSLLSSVGTDVCPYGQIYDRESFRLEGGEV
jgi:hypothetical protein